MKIKCIATSWASIPDCFCIDETLRQSTTDYCLKLNFDYLVYGITIKDNFIYYYLSEDENCDFPLWKPSPFFTVIDTRLSRYWIYNYKKVKNYRPSPILTFPEWANNHPDFYDRLTDWEEEEIAIFRRYKELMDLEFEDPSVTEYAQKEEDGWLICKSCFEAWQSFNTLDALIKCPQCEKILNNPSYIKSDYSLTRPF